MAHLAIAKNDSAPVLILGAGINGAALARELVLNGVAVCLVDQADLAFGATAYSSRLVHGGLRYLEYGEFSLVRESLAERDRLVTLAPQFVQPLKLYIPVERRWGGWIRSAGRFVGLERLVAGPPHRGLWMVRLGLALYDRLAHDAAWPRYSVEAIDNAEQPPLNRAHYRWLCAYHDAQIRFPERFVVALLADAQATARQQGQAFDVHTYSCVTVEGRQVTVRSADQCDVQTFEPAAVVNATGAWVDLTLQRLHVSAPQLMGGTKGSHLVSGNQRLRAALSHGGVYAEAADGRPVFLLPFGPLSLIGTTDLPFVGDPSAAVATEEEINYLLSTVNALLPDIHLQRDDVLLHYCGVRPLPAVDASRPAAITRRHWLEEHADAPWPLYSVIGGKLTTCRSLAESAADTLLARLCRERIVETRDRPIAGGLFETAGPQLTEDVIRSIIRHEWVQRLEDLVERRLMLLYDASLSRARLEELADLLIAEGRLPASNKSVAVDTVVARLASHFGRSIS